MINYQIIQDSITYYEKCGFNRIESPWLVTQAIDNITKPNNIQSYYLEHNKKCLVASGEQSFLYLYLKDYLPKGKFQTVTPCFRDEQYDQLHSKNFIKNELICTNDISSKQLDDIIDMSLSFFKKYIPNCIVVKTDIGYDIEIDNMELGSYGIRSCEYLDWIYATGVAEPRLSKVIEILKRKGSV